VGLGGQMEVAIGGIFFLQVGNFYPRPCERRAAR